MNQDELKTKKERDLYQYENKQLRIEINDKKSLIDDLNLHVLKLQQENKD
jgi:hypothetical protein